MPPTRRLRGSARAGAAGALRGQVPSVPVGDAARGPAAAADGRGARGRRDALRRRAAAVRPRRVAAGLRDVRGGVALGAVSGGCAIHRRVCAGLVQGCSEKAVGIAERRGSEEIKCGGTAHFFSVPTSQVAKISVPSVCILE